MDATARGRVVRAMVWCDFVLARGCLLHTVLSLQRACSEGVTHTARSCERALRVPGHGLAFDTVPLYTCNKKT
jgi:hypothetical protein